MKNILYILLAAVAMTFAACKATQVDRSIVPVAGPAPKIQIGQYQLFTLDNGLKVIVVENHKLPRVSFTLTLDNAPYTEGAKKGVADLTSSLIGNGTKKISKTAFNEEIDFMGASINFSSNGASGNSLSKYSGRVLQLLAEGALNPNFTQEEFDTFENYFNEENWIIFQTEFEEVVKFEIGAIINSKDEFDWKFGK
jgi:hypothetical protein